MGLKDGYAAARCRMGKDDGSGSTATIDQLQHLSLINKICQELDNHLGN